jgi:hypothetical protein
MKIAKLLILALFTITMSSAASRADEEFTVTATGFMYQFNGGVSNPTLTLDRGGTYIFDISAPIDPFEIKTLPGTGSINTYNDGVTNNGASAGSIVFTVPISAPDTLFYSSEVHVTAQGQFNIVSVPEPVALPLFFMGLAAAATVRHRRRT